MLCCVIVWGSIEGAVCTCVVHAGPAGESHKNDVLCVRCAYFYAIFMVSDKATTSLSD